MVFQNQVRILAGFVASLVHNSSLSSSSLTPNIPSGAALTCLLFLQLTRFFILSIMKPAVQRNTRVSIRKTHCMSLNLSRLARTIRVLALITCSQSFPAFRFVNSTLLLLQKALLKPLFYLFNVHNNTDLINPPSFAKCLR